MSKDLKFRIWDKKNNRFLNQNEKEGLVLLDLSGNVRIAEWSLGNGDNASDSVFEAAEDQDRYIIEIKEEESREKSQEKTQEVRIIDEGLRNWIRKRHCNSSRLS